MTTNKASLDFWRDGYVILRGFLEDVELPDLAEEVASVLLAPCDEACRRPHNQLFPLRWNDPIVERMLGCGQRLERIAIASHADDLRWISGYVSVKSPRSPPLWWHQDWWCWDHPVSFRRAASQVAVLSYLGSTNGVNGALRVLPGTHCRSGGIHATLPDLNSNAAENLSLDHAVFHDQPGQVTIELDAGDAVMVDYRLLHGTHANDTDFRRDCVILNFAPSWSALPDDVRGHLICHPALPREDEVVSGSCRASKVLPKFGGSRVSLSLNRNAPAVFACDT